MYPIAVKVVAEPGIKKPRGGNGLMWVIAPADVIIMTETVNGFTTKLVTKNILCGAVMYEDGQMDQVPLERIQILKPASQLIGFSGIFDTPTQEESSSARAQGASGLDAVDQLSG